MTEVFCKQWYPCYCQQQLEGITDWEAHPDFRAVNHGRMVSPGPWNTVITLQPCHQCLPWDFFSFSSGLLLLLLTFHIFLFLFSFSLCWSIFWSNFLRMDVWEANFLRPWLIFWLYIEFKIENNLSSQLWRHCPQCLIRSGIADDASGVD